MIYSMTGFGKASFMINGTAYAVEIRSLNSKQLDLNIRIPAFLKEKEMLIRKIAGDGIKRGKVDITVYSEKKEDAGSYIINKEVVQQYRKQIEELNQNFALDNKDYLDSILKLPNVLKVEENTIDDNSWTDIEQGIKTAIEQLNNFRIQEGNSLERDFVKCIETIETLSFEVAENAPKRIEKVRNRINENLQKIKDKVELNQDRFEQELIFYVEKIDINEEIVRLKNHIKYFKEIIAEEIVVKGKKIGFIAQEVGREINTIGSKANDATIQKLVVQMKDELEKIKEQSFNTL